MAGLARRRHDRKTKIAKRMRFLREHWGLSPYGRPEMQPPGNYFIPGRYAKIHPGRVCSCIWCQGDPADRKRERAQAKRDIRSQRV